MTTPSDFDDRRHQREWEAQERALGAERSGAKAESDPRAAEYRLLARILADPPLDPVPADFAALTAARAEQGGGLTIEEAVAPHAADDRFEIWLQRALVVLLLWIGIGIGVAYTAGWWQLGARGVTAAADFLRRATESSAVGWTLAIVVCVAVSAALHRLGRDRERRTLAI